MTEQHAEGQAPETFTAEQMREVRAEAKDWRLKLRDAEKQVADLETKLADQATQIETLTATNIDLESKLDGIEKEREHAELVAGIAEKAGLPAELLRGTTREELEEHANQLQPVYRKATGPFVPEIGDVPATNNNEVEQFVHDLFGTD